MQGFDMDLTSLFQPGMKKEETFIIEDKHSAMHVGSGSSRILATPWMIGFMERVAHHLLAEKLPEGYSSVGALVNIRHLAPTPVGSQVNVRAEIETIEGLKVTFKVEAWDEAGLIGSGFHERVVIDTARFLRRIENRNKGVG
jgi:predicted thioesterase